MYALIVAFESDIRRYLDKYVLTELSESEVFGPSLEELKLRRSRDAQSESASLVEYLDLRPEYDLLNSHREYLPKILSDEVRELTPELDVLTPIRHRLMHSRPLRESDAESFRSSIGKFTSSFWTELRLTLKLIESDPNWEPADIQYGNQLESVLNNLPPADYDDTGLLGREEQVLSLVDLLKKRRERVITLTGEGGIGKTALAIEAASRLLDDVDHPFDLILWVNLKKERLTGSGISEIKNVASSLIGAAVEAASDLDKTFQGGVDALSDTLSGFRTLICIDNLESISGDEFVDFYDQMPADVTFLVTSRKGIGQLERRISINALSENAALMLLNQLIRYRNVTTLAKITAEQRKAITQALRNSPLAIRWFILATEAGRSPDETLSNQDELISYCVRSVYDSLSQNAQNVLVALFVTPRQLSLDDLVILLESEVKLMRDGLQELTQGSLVKYEVLPSADLRTIVSPSESAKMFLASIVHEDNPIKILVSESEKSLQAQDERRRIDESNRSLAPAVIRLRNDLDKPVSHLLRRAVLEIFRSDFEQAQTLIADALRLSPDYWEVQRIEGFLASEKGDLPLALTKYLEAYRSAETKEHKAVVAHFLAGHLARKAGDLDQAIVLARESNSIFDSPETKHALGNYLIWAGKFEEGENLLREALKKAEGPLQHIVTTAIGSACRRRAENIFDSEKNILLAHNKALEGFNAIADLVNSGVADRKLTDELLELARLILRIYRKAESSRVNVPGINVALETLLQLMPRLSRHRFFDRLIEDLQKTNLPKPFTAENFITSSMPTLSSQDEVLFRGQIMTIEQNQNYGFISSLSFEENVHFHRFTLQNENFGNLKYGDTVYFSTAEATDSRIRAHSVWVTEEMPTLEVLQKRALDEEILLHQPTAIEARLDYVTRANGVKTYFAIPTILPFFQLRISSKAVGDFSVFNPNNLKEFCWIKPSKDKNGELIVREFYHTQPLSEEDFDEYIVSNSRVSGVVRNIRFNTENVMLYLFVTLDEASGHTIFVHESEVSEKEKALLAIGSKVLISVVKGTDERYSGTNLSLV
jgi:cold shock CspA family protein/tetratricopeptide (TPR) repeat protein